MAFYTEIAGYYANILKKIPECYIIVRPEKIIITTDGFSVLKYLPKEDAIELWDKKKPKYKFFIRYNIEEKIVECYNLVRKLGISKELELWKKTKWNTALVVTGLEMFTMKCSSFDDAVKGLKVVEKCFR